VVRIKAPNQPDVWCSVYSAGRKMERRGVRSVIAAEMPRSVRNRRVTNWRMAQRIRPSNASRVEAEMRS
jgi:hypothetical protein